MEDWQKRVVDEKAALDVKISALNKYIEGNQDFRPEEYFDHELLNEQFYLMAEYSNVLNMRILRF
jgi:hypothetical protein